MFCRFFFYDKIKVSDRFRRNRQARSANRDLVKTAENLWTKDMGASDEKKIVFGMLFWNQRRYDGSCIGWIIGGS